MYLNFLQLKIARQALNLGVREIGSLIQTSRTTISKLENNIIKVRDMRLAKKRNAILHEYFRQNNIIFPNEYSVEFSSSYTIAQPPAPIKKLTRFQLKSSRVILQKSQKELAELTKTKLFSIIQAEKLSNESFVKSEKFRDISSLINMFYKNGIKYPNYFSISFKKIVDKVSIHAPGRKEKVGRKIIKKN